MTYAGVTAVVVRVYDDAPAAYALVEPNLPAGEAWQARGYLFVAPDIGASLGPSDATVKFGETEWPAWKLS